jgi:hypothetical protein
MSTRLQQGDGGYRRRSARQATRRTDFRSRAGGDRDRHRRPLSFGPRRKPRIAQKRFGGGIGHGVREKPARGVPASGAASYGHCRSGIRPSGSGSVRERGAGDGANPLRPIRFVTLHSGKTRDIRRKMRVCGEATSDMPVKPPIFGVAARFSHESCGDAARRYQ